MNNNRSDAPERKRRVTIRSNQAGRTRIGTVLENHSGYCNKTSRSEQKARVQGSNGVGLKQVDSLLNTITYLDKTYPGNRIKWLIFKYAHLKPRIYHRLHTNHRTVTKRIRGLIDTAYGRKFVPYGLYIVKHELSEERSKATGLPYFDINIVMVFLDENGEPYFDEKELTDLIKNIYRVLSEVAGTTIEVPPSSYAEDIKPYGDDFRNWSTYFGKETDKELLERFKKSGHDKYFPKKWWTCPSQLKEDAAKEEKLLADTTEKAAINVMKDEFPDQMNKLELHKKGGASINWNLNEYDCKKYTDRMEVRLRELTDDVERNSATEEL